MASLCPFSRRQPTSQTSGAAGLGDVLVRGAETVEYVIRANSRTPIVLRLSTGTTAQELRHWTEHRGACPLLSGSSRRWADVNDLRLAGL
jgi:hypothetical protein